MQRTLPIRNFLPRVTTDDTIIARFTSGCLASVRIDNKVQAQVCELYGTKPHHMIESLWTAIQKRYQP